MKTFPNATEDELDDLVNRVHGALVDWMTVHKFSGGSMVGGWDVYAALEDGIRNEHKRCNPAP